MSSNQQLDNSRMSRFMLLIVMAGTTMLYSLTITLVNIILPQLQGAMSASQDQISWIITLNVLATAIATPINWFSGFPFWKTICFDFLQC